MIPTTAVQFYGDQTRWFIARVININDPLEMGRVRIRIIGLHDNNEIREGDLPWAQVVVPVTEGMSSGIGTNVGIKEQSQVFGIFLDGAHSQLPLVVGSISKYEQNVIDKYDDLYQQEQNTKSNPTAGIDKNIRPPEVVDSEFLFGDTNIEKAYNFLITKEGGNLSPIAASGILGNFCVESGANQNNGDINPLAQAPGEGSFGIAQWNPSEGAGNRFGQLRNFAGKLNLTYTSLYAQLLWTRQELITQPYLGLSELKAATTVSDATKIFMKKYERPAYEVANINGNIIKTVDNDGSFRRLGQDDRIEFAEEIYRKFNT
jgi:hypothetical protein